ncbi:MAG: gliding motility-associated C-terminal domain-containing protein [Salibacteraceae bacterium]
MFQRLVSVIFFIALFSFFPSKTTKAVHLYGGNVNYIYMADTTVSGVPMHLYTVALTLYLKCDDARWPFQNDGNRRIAVYEGGLNDTILPQSTRLAVVPMIWQSADQISSNLPNACVDTSLTCIGKVIYTNTVLLPSTFIGYHFVYDEGARVNSITNFNSPSKGMLLPAWSAGPATKNSSPVFRDLNRSFLCVGQTKTVVNLALDIDGDQLNYEFYQPFVGESGGTTSHIGGYAKFPSDTMPFNPTYNLTQLFGPSGSASINGLTGLARIKGPNITGDFIVGVKVKELDQNGNTIGTTHREFQFPVQACKDTNTHTPNLKPGSQTDFTIEAGDSLCFDIDFTSTGAGLGFEYEVFGEPFLPTTIPAATKTTPVFSGNTSNQTICWTPSCSQARPTNYYFTASVADSACLPGDTTVAYSIKVDPFEGPKVLTGPSGSCQGGNADVYSTDTIAGATYNWTVVGGTIVGASNGPSIVVDWGISTGGNVKVSAVSQFGCPSDPLDLSVFFSSIDIVTGADRTICFGDTTTLGSTQSAPTAPNGTTIKWTPSNLVDNDTSQNPLAFPTQTTVFYLTVTDTAGTCTAVDSVVVTVLQNTNAGISNNDTTICEGDQVQLNAFGGSIYKWTPSSGVSDDTLINPFTTIDSTTTFICEITDTGAACPAFDTVIVTVNTKKEINAGLDSSICLNETYTLGGSPTAPVGSIFKWTPNTNLSFDTVANPVVTPTNSGSTRYILDVTTAAGCQFKDTVTIQVDTVPTLLFDAAKDTICAGEMDTLSARGANTYTWLPASLPQNQSFQFISPTVTTKYTATGTDLNFCSSTDSITIVVNPLPEITIPHDSIFLCLGDTVQLTSTTGASSYKWSPNTALIPADTVESPFVFPGSNITYTVNITGLNGCDNIDSIYILVDDTIPTDAGLSQLICFPDTIAIGGNPTSLSFNTTYSWSPGVFLSDSLIANPNSFTDTSTLYTVTSKNGSCIGIDSVKINVSPKPVLTYKKNPYEICKGDTVQLDTNVGVSAVALPKWSHTNTLSDSTIFTPLAFPDTTTTYTINFSDGVCNGTTKVTVLVSNGASIDAGKDTIACQNIEIALKVNGANTYSWSPGVNLNDSTISNPIATLDTTTEFIVTGTTTLGCIGTDTITVSVKAAPVIDAGGPFIICSDSITSITLGGNPTAPLKSTYAWSSPNVLDNPTIANPTTSFIIPSTYYLIVTDSNGCVSTDSAVVRTFSFETLAGVAECNGDSAQLSVVNINGNGPFTYRWSPDYGLNATDIPNPVSTADSSVIYQVIVEDSLGCRDSNDVILNLENVVKASFDINIVAGCDNAIGETVNNSIGGSSFKWYLNGELVSEDYDIIIPMDFNDSKSIKLIVTDGGNCVDSSSTDRQIKTFVDYFDGQIPNVFTPNDDGYNDVFDVQVGQRLQGCTSVKIYNRWGAHIFESRENSHSWDGRTFSGDLCPPGVYFYLLDINGTAYQGYVTLIRD